MTFNFIISCSCTSFWLDHWIGTEAPYLCFPKLFDITEFIKASIADVCCLESSSFTLNFGRNLKEDEIDEWAALTHLILLIHLTQKENIWD